MNIKIRDFILKPEVNAVERFNLLRVVEVMREKEVKDDNGVVIHEKGSIKLAEKNIGYGFSLENAVNRIISTTINDIDGNIELKTYINEYKVIKNEIFKKLDL